MEIYRALNRWKEALSSTVSGLRTPDLVLLGGATIQLLDGLNVPVQQWELIRIFPTALGEISLGKEEKDTFMQFDCTFSVTDIYTQLI